MLYWELKDQQKEFIEWFFNEFSTVTAKVLCIEDIVWTVPTESSIKSLFNRINRIEENKYDSEEEEEESYINFKFDLYKGAIPHREDIVLLTNNPILMNINADEYAKLGLYRLEYRGWVVLHPIFKYTNWIEFSFKPLQGLYEHKIKLKMEVQKKFKENE